MRILVADDSKTNLALLSASLNNLGHEVIAATSGAAAIELYKEQRPDLIILDVVMEGMDGFQCAKQIREIDYADWIPIIFLSASVDDVSIAKGIDAGGDDYLTKPFSEITLAAKIKAMQRIADMRNRLFETTQKLYLLSSTDTLTGLYNRLQFDRSLKEIIGAADRYHYTLALLFIDLDNFKNVNDSFGHHIGDVLLSEVAARLKSSVRSVDFVARLGGDEFAIILSQVNPINIAEEIAQKIVDMVSFDYNLEAHNVRIGASVGVAYYPDTASNSEILVLNADVAMYHAKSLGRNNYQVFTEELNDRYRQQISIEHALKFALERQELYLTYQPIFNLETSELCGLEALICWEHPKFGLISPSLFIPIAEETGLITHIGSWVLKTACEQSTKWNLEKYKDFRFAINISSRQLIHGDFYQHVMNIIADTKMHASYLELELTETTMMTYADGPFRDTIKKLNEAGIKISIDDFGTGYSSLVRLKHLPITTLKIEKSFVQDSVKNESGAIIVSCLIALGKNLGLNVIAEGVETKEQLEFLKLHQCPQVQGFYLSKPLKATQVSEYLEKLNKKEIKTK